MQHSFQFYYILNQKEIHGNQIFRTVGSTFESLRYFEGISDAFETDHIRDYLKSSFF